jgi:predicted O-linked N-acetylglucosamine transferase (SPINDLY family)
MCVHRRIIKMKPHFRNTPKPKSAAANPDAARAQARFQQGLALHHRGQLAQAQEIYQQVLTIHPQHFDALHLLGVIAYQTGNHAQALGLIDRAIAIYPNNAAFYSNRGNALLALSRSDEALDSYDRAIKLKPDYAEAYFNRGNALQALGRLGEALDSHDRALEISPDFAEVYNNRGLVLKELKRLGEALDSYDRAIKLKPDYAEAHNNRGLVLKELQRLGEALDSYELALKLKPDYAKAYNNRGDALQDLKRLDEALDSYGLALKLKPDYAEAYYNRGNALKVLKRLDEALDSYDRALKIKPDFAEAYNNRGNALLDLERPDEALASYNHALKIKPDFEFLYGTWLFTKMKLCDWSDAEGQIAELVGRIECNTKATPPFPVLALSGSLALQRKAAELWVNDNHPAGHALPAIVKCARHRKIRIGYYSADYDNHATAHLMAGLFEEHDREKFELVAFSFGPDRNDEMRKRISAAFDRFIDVQNKSDKDIALLSRNMEVDIAVDLKGFTQDQRVGIFSYRPAPIQVNYLGYPGTMGAKYFDYLIADSTLIPNTSQRHYSEKIAYLPNSYQVNDRKRQIADKHFSREELGLPQTGFVFCCFNNNYKLMPRTFDGWMRILKQVDGSVLWLLEDNPTAARNLRKEAGARGVSAERLIFAKRMPLAEHLARHRVADLFIDTLPCNAHTTASDALWAGLPLLTCVGDTFAGRVAASLLNAIDLPELVATTQERYEALAVELATNTGRLKDIRQKLESNRLTTPLFDTRMFTKHIEAAYTQMYERYQADLPPEHIYVTS